MAHEAGLADGDVGSSIELDANGVLQCHFRGESRPRRIAVRYNYAPWATVPGYESPDGATRFSCELPVLAKPESADIEVRDADTGEALLRCALHDRQPRLNDFGVSAHDIQALHGRPFYAVPYMRFDGSKLVITGSHLPPMGDPSKLGVEFGEGVVFDFQYPIKSPGWGGHFWYWPNSVFSDFILTIDLTSCAKGSDPFHFRFTYPEGMTPSPREDWHGDLAAPYGHVWIPRDLGSYTGFPNDITQLTRVQTWSDQNSVTMTGFNAYKTIEAYLLRYGIKPGRGVSVMDWGCGHGRVTRHFIDHWAKADIIGMDIDAENIGWCKDHLAGGQFYTSPLMPPSPLRDSSIDAVFSISVMTHLTAPIQAEWLKELARVLKPGGLALISFGGPGAVAWSSVWHTPEYYAKWNAAGFHADQEDPALDGKIGSNDYYRNAAQNWDYTIRHWSHYFEILTIHPEGIGNLDFAVMRKR